MEIRTTLATILVSCMALVTTACATSMTNQTSADTLDQGEIEGNVNGQINLNTAIVRTGIQAGKKIEEEVKNTPQDGTIEEESVRTAIDFLLATALFRPQPTPEATLRVGLFDKPLEGLEAAIKFNGTIPKGELKLQYWASEDDRWAASVQAGFNYQSGLGPSDILSNVTLTEWNRFDLDILAPVGVSLGEFARFWLAPRFMWSRVTTTAKTDNELFQRLPSSIKSRVKQRRNQLFSGSNDLFYAGLNIGGMVGYKYAYFSLEATVTRVFFRPEILGEERNLSGFSIVPSAAVVFNFGPFFGPNANSEESDS